MTYSETRIAYSRETSTRRFVAVVVALALAFIGYLTLSANLPVSFAPPLAASTVKVEIEKGHGSGVHIGEGLILSAAHVASEGDVVKLKLDDGTTRDATVVWSTKASDVALLRTSPAGLSASELNCGPVVIGQAVTAHGNPLDIEFISTYGHIVGAAQARGPWAVAAVVDMEIIPGMSGGPVLNPQGEVVGLAVGLLTLTLGFSSSATGIGMIVPAEHICGLLGRT